MVNLRGALPGPIRGRRARLLSSADHTHPSNESARKSPHRQTSNPDVAAIGDRPKMVAQRRARPFAATTATPTRTRTALQNTSKEGPVVAETSAEHQHDAQVQAAGKVPRNALVWPFSAAIHRRCANPTAASAQQAMKRWVEEERVQSVKKWPHGDREWVGDCRCPLLTFGALSPIRVKRRMLNGSQRVSFYGLDTTIGHGDGRMTKFPTGGSKARPTLKVGLGI